MFKESRSTHIRCLQKTMGVSTSGNIIATKSLFVKQEKK